jgi:hypothetical protein
MKTHRISLYASRRRRPRMNSNPTGSSDNATIASATSEKFSLTTGTLPNAKPASVQTLTQRMPPRTL